MDGSLRTEFEVLLWTAHKLADPGCETLRQDEVFTAIRMLTNEEAQDFNKVGI